MNIESAKYKSDEDRNVSITAVIDGVTIHVPLDLDNRHYAAILEWAKEDGNEIQAAE
jgi:hypothetical protein